MIIQEAAVLIGFGAIALYAAYRSIYSESEQQPRVTYALVIIALLAALALAVFALSHPQSIPDGRIGAASGRAPALAKYTEDFFYSEYTCYQLFYGRTDAITICTARPI